MDTWADRSKMNVTFRTYESDILIWSLSQIMEISKEHKPYHIMILFFTTVEFLNPLPLCRTQVSHA